jgi:hypothetical protein
LQERNNFKAKTGFSTPVNLKGEGMSHGRIKELGYQVSGQIF